MKRHNKINPRTTCDSNFNAETAPVPHKTTAVAPHPELLPEWITVKEAVRLFSCSRSRIYELMHDPRIKSSIDRKRGNVLGRRRIYADSLREYFHSLADEQASERASRHQVDQDEGCGKISVVS
jgi:hypothetical protein